MIASSDGCDLKEERRSKEMVRPSERQRGGRWATLEGFSFRTFSFSGPLVRMPFSFSLRLSLLRPFFDISFFSSIIH